MLCSNLFLFRETCIIRPYKHINSKVMVTLMYLQCRKARNKGTFKLVNNLFWLYPKKLLSISKPYLCYFFSEVTGDNKQSQTRYIF